MMAKRLSPLKSVDLGQRIEDHQEYKDRLRELQVSSRQLAYRLFVKPVSFVDAVRNIEFDNAV
jgi:hypothetical protein